MAEKRMFSRGVVDSDRFLEMDLRAQALYFHLGLRADDDGFVDAPRKIQRMIGANEVDVEVLIDRGFVIPFSSGVIVITHWNIHNRIKSDRYRPTVYQRELGQLWMQPDKTYAIQSPSEMQNLCIGSELEPIRNQTGTKTEHRIEENRKGKKREEEESMDSQMDPEIFEIPFSLTGKMHIEEFARGYLRNVSEDQTRELLEFSQRLPEGIVRKAITEAHEKANGSYLYAKAILKRYIQDTSKFNYQQHSYTEADFGPDFYYDPSKDYGAGG